MVKTIEEKMSKIDRTIWNKLQASIKPHLSRINKEEKKLKNQVQKTIEIVNGLKSEIADYQQMITEIEAKYIEEDNTENETENVEEESLVGIPETPSRVEDAVSPESFMEDYENLLSEEAFE